MPLSADTPAPVDTTICSAVSNTLKKSSVNISAILSKNMGKVLGAIDEIVTSPDCFSVIDTGMMFHKFTNSSSKLNFNGSSAMIKNNLWAWLLIAGFSWQNASADEASETALQQTQDCLRGQNCESAATAAGTEADRKALETVGGNPAEKQELYNIAASIMPILVQESGGDPQKMQAILEKAKADPEGFINSMPESVKKQIKNTAAQSGQMSR